MITQQPVALRHAFCRVLRIENSHGATRVSFLLLLLLLLLPLPLLLLRLLLLVMAANAAVHWCSTLKKQPRCLEMSATDNLLALEDAVRWLPEGEGLLTLNLYFWCSAGMDTSTAICIAAAAPYSSSCVYCRLVSEGPSTNTMPQFITIALLRPIISTARSRLQAQVHQIAAAPSSSRQQQQQQLLEHTTQRHVPLLLKH